MIELKFPPFYAGRQISVACPWRTAYGGMLFTPFLLFARSL